MSHEVDSYNVLKVWLAHNIVVSQKTYLSPVSHDIIIIINQHLITALIVKNNQVWIGAGVFIHKGKPIGQGGGIVSTAFAYKDAEPGGLLAEILLNF